MYGCTKNLGVIHGGAWVGHVCKPSQEFGPYLVARYQSVSLDNFHHSWHSLFFESSLIWSYWRGDALGIIFLSAKLTRCLAFLFTCCIACKILVISCVSRHLLLMLLFHCIACGRSPASWPRVVAEKLGRSDTEGMYYQTVMLILFLFYFHRCISDWCITVYLFKKTVVDVVVRRTLNH